MVDAALKQRAGEGPISMEPCSGRTSVRVAWALSLAVAP